MCAIATMPPQLDGLMLFGFLSAFVALVCWIYRNESRELAVAFALCLAATAVYAFLAGAWPVGIVQIAWSAIAMRQCFIARKLRQRTKPLPRRFARFLAEPGMN